MQIPNNLFSFQHSIHLFWLPAAGGSPAVGSVKDEAPTSRMIRFYEE